LLYRSCRVLLYTWIWLYCNSSMTCGFGFWRACRRSGICFSLVVVVRYREKVLVEGRRGRLLLLLLSSISRANVWIENQICSKVSFLFTRVWIERERERERERTFVASFNGHYRRCSHSSFSSILSGSSRFWKSIASEVSSLGFRSPLLCRLRSWQSPRNSQS
jgi:hypothetical protein